jgi:hypothetical protein
MYQCLNTYNVAGSVVNIVYVSVILFICIQSCLHISIYAFIHIYICIPMCMYVMYVMVTGNVATPEVVLKECGQVCDP